MAGNPDEALLIDCPEHGQRPTAIVCRHQLQLDRPVGFVENNEDPHDLQAWCTACEELFTSVGEMSDEFLAFNDMAVVCTDCYERRRQFHTT